jgi:hypothetical protein
MNAPPEHTNVPGPAPARHGRVTVLAGAAIMLLFGLGLYFALRPVPANDLIWLTPAQFAQASHAGPWTRLKYRVKALLGPALKYVRPSRPNIITRETMLALNAEAARLAEPQRPAMATNTAGISVWELSAAELKAVQQRLPTLPGAQTLRTGAIVTASGGQARLMMLDAQSPGARSAPAGLTCDASAKYSGGAICLLLGLTSTEKAPAGAGQSQSLQTNFTFACRARLENAGALLIERRADGSSASTNYWFIVSSTAVDARGNPIAKR